jgi:hypothetical protein
MKLSNVQSDKNINSNFNKLLSTCYYKTQNGLDRRKYLAPVTRLVQCDKHNFQSYTQILIILAQLQTAFNVALFLPIAQRF